MNIRPILNNVLVRREKAETVSPGGIIIPDAAQKKSERCVVVATGPGKPLDNGTVLPMPVKPGDVVYIPQWQGSEVTLDGEQLLFVKDDVIMGVSE